MMGYGEMTELFSFAKLEIWLALEVGGAMAMTGANIMFWRWQKAMSGMQICGIVLIAIYSFFGNVYGI